MKTVVFERLDHFRILDNDKIKITTNKTEDIFIIKNSLKQNHHFAKLRKINKNEFINLETGETRKYKQSNYKTDKSIRRSMSKLKELLEINFTNTSNCLYITLTTANLLGFNNIDTVKKCFAKFIRKLKSKYKDIAYIAKYERHSNGNWHIHLLARYTNDRPIFISNKEIETMWGNNTKTIKVNRKEINNLIGYMCKTTQLNNIPKDTELFTKSKNLSLKKLEMTYIEFKEIIQNNYTKMTEKAIIVRNIMTNKILNVHKKMIFTKKPQKVISRTLYKTLNAEVIIALVYLVLFNSNVF